jgi:dTDP-4-amino-4,6-dideoxygalactose transaminase
MMKIPFVDLKAQYQSIKKDMDEAIRQVIDETAFIGGKHVKAFEESFADLYEANHVVPCGNGTDSLFILMKMLGIGKGDEVITAANSWISSSETITQTGATPVFVDIHPEYYSMDENLIETSIRPQTKAIIVVHLHGQVCEMEALESICNRHGLFLIEDCAQAHFSEYKGVRAGMKGIAGSFSFFPGKNLGAYGDAGCIITKDEALATKCRAFANHGALKKHHHFMEGINSRMDGLQAAILRAKLPYVLQWIDQRIANAAFYDNQLAGIDEIILPKIRPLTKHSFHLYVIRCRQRDELKEYLERKGIETLIHYPTPLPFLPAYQYLRLERSDFPVAAQLQQEILSLPMYPELKEEMIGYVAAQIKSFYKNNRA